MQRGRDRREMETWTVPERKGKGTDGRLVGPRALRSRFISLRSVVLVVMRVLERALVVLRGTAPLDSTLRFALGLLRLLRSLVLGRFLRIVEIQVEGRINVARANRDEGAIAVKVCDLHIGPRLRARSGAGFS